MPARKNDSEQPEQTEETASASAPVQDAPPLPEIDDESLGQAAEARRELAVEEQDETNVVRYIGVFSERSISREDWEKAGVSEQEAVTWTKDAMSLPIENFSDEALRVLSANSDFQIVREEDED